MKSLQELYSEIIGSDEVKKAYLDAAKGGKIAEFLKDQGCEATEEDIKAFLKGKADQPLSDAELDSVAGGACNHDTASETLLSVLSVGTGCAIWAIVSGATDGKHTGQRKDDEGRICNSD